MHNTFGSVYIPSCISQNLVAIQSVSNTNISPEQMVKKKKKKRTQRRARLHGNAATEKNGKDFKEAVPRAETYFYLFISLQSSFPVGAEPGGVEEISPKKAQSQIPKIFMME